MFFHFRWFAARIFVLWTRSNRFETGLKWNCFTMKMNWFKANQIHEIWMTFLILLSKCIWISLPQAATSVVHQFTRTKISLQWNKRINFEIVFNQFFFIVSVKSIELICLATSFNVILFVLFFAFDLYNSVSALLNVLCTANGSTYNLNIVFWLYLYANLFHFSLNFIFFYWAY